jgi:hypothetical protein
VFLTDVYTADYRRGGESFTLFVTEDPGEAKLKAWRRSAEAAPGGPDAALQSLPFHESRYLLAADPYHGRILAGPFAGRLLGMVGYDPAVSHVMGGWLRSLMELD